ncbi:MAG: undecaprenyl-diphosphatase [Acidobacteria bacterium]|jgi:undecaprenyl-diphosphatase|nr:undecaprenyl-diphosphatase [Acidobacteriota bacterium]
MEILYAAILGIIQGLTEFLPISSSAHLILVPWFLGWEPEGIAFDVSLHVGTAIAVLAFFWRDWVRLGRDVIAGLKQGTLFVSQSQKLFWMLVVGTIPALIAGLALEGTAASKLRSPLITVFTLAALAAVLYWAERKSKQNRNMDHFTWADSIWIGLSQALSLIPGVSRSGITMTTAMFRDSDRTSAARFSFLLSTPVIVGAGLLEGWHLMRALRSAAAGTAEVNWIVMVVGTVFAGVTGFLCIRYFLRYLQTRNFTPFVVYRCVLALIVLVYYLKNH